MRFALLGVLEVRDTSRLLDLGRGKQRALLAVLLLHANESVATDELIDALWPAGLPVRARKSLQVAVSRLRALIGPDRLSTTPDGYALRIDAGELDLAEFERLTSAAQALVAEGDLQGAEAGFIAALDQWRGPALAEFRYAQFAQQPTRLLEEARATVRAELVDVRIALGKEGEVLSELEALISERPYWERLRHSQMLALYRVGRQVDALSVFRETRRLLADDLGLEPGPELQQLEREILSQDPAIARPPGRSRMPTVSRRAGVVSLLVGVAALLGALFLLGIGVRMHSSARPHVAADSIAVLDARSGHLLADMPLAASPDAITAGDGSIWAAMPDRGIVSGIDTTTNTVQQTIRTPGPGGPTALTFGGGFVWVADTLASTVFRIDPRANGGQLVGNPIRVGNDPTGIAYGLGAVWVANSVDRTVTRINPATGAPGPPISVEDGADDIAVGDGSVWVIGRSNGVLSRIDPTAHTVVGTTGVDDPAAVAIGPDAVWVANGANGTVSKIDPSTGDLEAAFPLGGQASGIAVAADGRVWVANAGSASLTVLDPATGRRIRVVHTGAVPGSVALVGGTAYVAAQVSPSVHRGGTLTLAIANAPGTYALPIPEELDPAGPCSTPPKRVKTSCALRGWSAWELLTLTNDGLLGYSQAGGADSYKVVADLATGVPIPSDGGLTYTFQLHQGVRYSTGGVVQPADIRRGIQRALLDSKGHEPGSYLAVIKGARGCLTGEHCDLTRGITTSPGSNTVTFHLSRPDPDFLLQLAIPDYDAVPASTPLHAHLPLPATGPYEIAGWRPTGVVVLVRNPRFRVWSAATQPDGYPDKIVERYRFTGAQAIHAVERGTADTTAEGLDQRWPPELAASLKTRYSSQLYPEPSPTILGLWLNTRVAPFNDIRVRQALNLAVDRNRLAQINAGEVACQFLPPDVDGYSAYCPYNGPNLTKARQLVAESGTKGEPVTIWSFEFPKGTPQPGRRNGLYFVAVLRSLGYDARLKLVPHEGVSYTWLPGRQAGIGGWSANIPSPNDILSGFLCSSYTSNPATNGDFAGLCDRRLDSEIARARALETTNPIAATAAWHRSDRMLTDDAPWVPMKVFVSTDFVSRRVGNYKYCWLSAASGLTGACLDQLWVR